MFAALCGLGAEGLNEYKCCPDEETCIRYTRAAGPNRYKMTQPRKLRVLSVHGEDGQNRTVSEGLL